RVNLLNVRAYLTPDCRARGKKGIRRRRRTIGLQPQNYSGQVSIVGLRPAKCVVSERRRNEGTIWQILKYAAPSLVTHKQVKLSIGPELQNAAIMISLLSAVGRARMS